MIPYRKSNSSIMTKSLLILVFAFICSFGAMAQDVITFMWDVESNVNKSVSIQATDAKEFTINWGDDTAIETQIGLGVGGPTTFITLSHIYAIAGQYTVTIAASNTDCRFFSFICSGNYDSENNQWINNQVNTLTLSGCTALSTLWCIHNKITNLDLTNCSALYELLCQFNTLTNLDLTGCSNLMSVACTNSQLKNINLNGCSGLINLYCSENELLKLDLTGCSSLVEVSCDNNQLTSINLSSCTALQRLYCRNNKLSNLNFSDCQHLQILGCHNNQLLLSDIYAAHLLIKSELRGQYGTQNLQPQTIPQGNMIDFSTQTVFGGILTNFLIERNGELATETDYSINNGKITFNTSGSYSITMDNLAILSHPDYPAKVIATINVGTTGLHDNFVSKIKVYPNPTSDKLFVECEKFSTITLYDMLGKEVLNQNLSEKSEININHLPKGIYNVRIISENKVVGNSKIVKQ